MTRERKNPRTSETCLAITPRSDFLGVRRWYRVRKELTYVLRAFACWADPLTSYLMWAVLDE